MSQKPLSFHFDIWCGHISVYVCVYVWLHTQFKFIEISTMICNHFRIIFHCWRSQMKQNKHHLNCVDIVYYSPDGWLVGWLAGIVMSNMFDISGCIACTYACHYTIYYYIWAQNAQKHRITFRNSDLKRMHFFSERFRVQEEVARNHLNWFNFSVPI